MRRVRFAFKMMIWLGTAAALLYGPRAAFPEDFASFRTNLFGDNGGLAVQAPSFLLRKDLSRRTGISLQYTLDRVGIPPTRGISGIPLATDGVTGASRPATADTSAGSNFIKKRNELLATLHLNKLNLTGYYSTEADYVGRLLSMGVNKDFNLKNTNFALSIGYGFDTINPTGRDTTFTRTNLIGNATLTQVLSKTAIMRIGVDVSYMQGYQVNPYRTVFINGGNFLETHPEIRTRAAGFLKINKYFTDADAALWLDYRLYADDWGIISHTLGLKFYQNIGERLLVRYRYRIYNQNSAWFYRENYPIFGNATYFTADYKLMPFYAQMFGFKISWQPQFLEKSLAFTENAAIDLKVERYFTSADFGANIVQLGMSFNY